MELLIVNDGRQEAFGRLNHPRAIAFVTSCFGDWLFPVFSETRKAINTFLFSMNIQIYCIYRASLIVFFIIFYFILQIFVKIAMDIHLPINVLI